MAIYNKIRDELEKRLSSSTDGSIKIRMKKSGDVAIITPDGPVSDPRTVYELKSLKLHPVYARGLSALAKEIADYDQILERQQELIEELYAFRCEKIDNGLATSLEMQQYLATYNRLYRSYAYA